MTRFCNIFATLCLLVLMAYPMHTFADAVGSWRIYPSYNTISDIEIVGNSAYVMASENLYSYNNSDGSIQTYDKTNSLSDINITHISWNNVAKRMIITYSDHNIDLLSANGETFNLPDLYMKVMTGDKTINSITQEGQYAYLATGFGVLKVDMKNEYMSDSYILGENIQQVAILGKKIYALKKSGGVMEADFRDNLNDPASWKDLTPIFFQYIYSFQGKLIGMTDGNINTINTETGEVLAFGLFPFSWVKRYDDRILCGKDNSVTEVFSDFTFKTYTSSEKLNVVAYDKTSKSYWSNNSESKLVRYVLNDNQLQPQTTGIIPDSPASNYSYRLCHNNGSLYVTAGGWSFTMDNRNRPGQVMVMKDNSWSEFQSEGLEALSGKYNDVNSVDVDPRDPEHAFVGGFNGLYEFRSGKCVRHYGVADGFLTYDDNPSKDYHVVISGVKYDSKGNLWVLNSITNRPLACLKTTGEWEFVNDYAGLQGKKAKTNDLEGLLIDGDNVWFGNERNQDAALFRYNTREGKMYATDTFFNQDGNPCNLLSIYDTAKDRNGNIWIGTEIGPFYIKPADIPTFTLTQHKVPRNDGTNYADYLLNNITVRCITVDAANRKWIGTANSGVFLISDDCNTQIHHFTAQNSSLRSDCVYDIAIDGKTGCVYFATENGVCSYMSDVLESNDDMDTSNVWAYPNPVTPEYTGLITVTGLGYNSQVTITTASGEKVASGRSNGGAFSWDGHDLNGNRVASGVYMVHVATAEGKSGVATKIAVVR